MNINEVVKNLRIPGKNQIRRVACKDGFSMSVQASRTHYCEPSMDLQEEYLSFEVGFPNAYEELLIRYAEDADTPTPTVYGWVPSDVIDKVIAKHGGVANVEALV